jgi:hypothetical protein
MHYYALTYDVGRDFAERRLPFRDAHLQLVRHAHERGLVVLAGAVGDPPDQALIVFRAESPAPVEEFARADPYVMQGLVSSWRVRPWNVVVGGELTPPKAL